MRPKGTRYAVGLGQWYFLLCLIAVSAGYGDDHSVFGAIVGLALFGACVPFVWRSGVYATGTGLTMLSMSGRPKEYPWASIKGFKVSRAGIGLGIYALVTDDTEVLLPSMAGWSPLRAKMQRVADALDEARAQALVTHGGPAAPQPGEEKDLAAVRQRLARQRLNVILIGLGAIACAAAGWAWTAEARWWALAAVGAVMLLVVIPIQLGLHAIDRHEAQDGRGGHAPDLQ
jgi:hypothetical protein